MSKTAFPKAGNFPLGKNQILNYLTKMLTGLSLYLTLLTTKVSAQQGIPIKITKVVDRDTVHGLVKQKIIKMRLNCIDAPESYDRLGPASTAALKQIVKNKTTTVIITSTDRYGRKLGALYTNGNSVQAQVSNPALKREAWL